MGIFSFLSSPRWDSNLAELPLCRVCQKKRRFFFNWRNKTWYIVYFPDTSKKNENVVLKKELKFGYVVQIHRSALSSDCGFSPAHVKKTSSWEVKEGKTGHFGYIDIRKWYIDAHNDTSIVTMIHRLKNNFLWQKKASGICPDGLTPHLEQLLGEVWSKNLKVRSEFWETQVSQKKSRYRTLGKTLGKFCQDKKVFVIESQNRSKTTLLTKSYKLHQLVCCLHL